MKILILYGTTEGQTRKIAEFAAAKLKSYGDVVTLLDATASTDGIDLRDYDAAILAASLHSGHYQAPVIHFARSNHAWLNQMPSAFISVSLSAASTDAEDLKGIATCGEKFKTETGWVKAEIHHVAGAFRFAEYDFFKRWVMKLIAWEKDVKVEPGKDFELTNWDGLSALVDAFRARIASTKRATTSASA
jgi:menaquinone-dependent protoporphyrinogen oxidase